jgi:hypothetical protein
LNRLTRQDPGIGSILLSCLFKIAHRSDSEPYRAEWKREATEVKEKAEEEAAEVAEVCKASGVRSLVHFLL